MPINMAGDGMENTMMIRSAFGRFAMDPVRTGEDQQTKNLDCREWNIPGRTGKGDAIVPAIPDSVAVGSSLSS